MLSLIVLVGLIVLFVILAMKNWRTTIGAGPTILIVGAIVVSVFGAVKWADYQSEVREYDVCRERVERSQDGGVFNRTLITIIERELPDEGIGKELRDVMLEPLEIKSCGEEPRFWNEFSQSMGVSNE